MRTIIVLLPQSRSLSPWMMLARARSLSSGATASSTSRKITSAALRAAFSNIDGLEPGTASSERCRRGVACSMVVKLMADAFKRVGFLSSRGAISIPHPARQLACASALATVAPRSAALGATNRPCDFMISAFSAAVSPSAEMMAPACPMRRPFGAVRPAT